MKSDWKKDEKKNAKILGSGKYSLKLIEAAVKYAGAELITLAVRRANTKEEENILDYIPKEKIEKRSQG